MEGNIRGIIKNFDSHNKDLKKFYILFFTALASALAFLEFIIPKPVPWFRIGLANSITLAFIYCNHYKEGLYISIFRPIVVSIFIGSIFSPGFFLSFIGSTISSIFMILSKKFLKKFLTIYGLSLIGAFIHSIIQVLFAYIFGLLMNIRGLMLVGGFITLLSIIGALVTGYISSKLIIKL